MVVPEEFRREYEEAMRGREIVAALNREAACGEPACWLLLPGEDPGLEALACGEVLTEFLRKQYYRRAVILSVCGAEGPSDGDRTTDGRRLSFRSLPRAEFEAVLRYYRLVQFAEDVIVVSRSLPYTFSAWVGHFGITDGQFLRDAAFGGRKINWLWWLSDGIWATVKQHAARLRCRKVYLFGWTRYAGEILKALEQHGIEVYGLVDSTPNKRTPMFTPRLPEDALVPYDPDASVVIVSKYGREMRETLYGLGYSEEQIVEIPVQGGIWEVQDGSRETLDAEFGKVLAGMELRRKAGKRTMIAVQAGTGDVYYACALIPGFLQARGIREYTLAIADNGSCQKVAELFGQTDIRRYSLTDLRLLYKAWEFLGPDRTGLLPFLNLGSRLPRALVPQKTDGKYPEWYHWRNCLRYQYFALPGVYALARPMQKDIGELLPGYLAAGLRRGKTVLLAPYCNAFDSTLSSKTNFWADLAAALQAKGYVVMTNCSGQEAPVPGTAPICVPYDELVPFLEFAGWFVAIRSGLCDIAANAHSCRMIHYYERAVSVNPEMWSLQKMGLHPQTVDLTYEGDARALLDRTLELFP